MPNTKASVSFLQQWCAIGPWVLTAITTDKKSIETKTFHQSSIGEMEKWIDRYNGDRNLYFHVNSVRTDLSKKAERQDIKALDWLHVDIDPRPGEDIEAEQKRALGMLQNPPSGVPEPTVIIFSGGGYQGFWKLREPLPIDGDLAKAEEAKLYNMQLELIYGADNCHNVDRIMRLPGTVNVPDERKKRKGRKAVDAYLVSFNENVYDISQFTPARAAPQTYTEQGFAGTTVQISGNIERYTSVDQLPETVSDRMKMVIVQGTDPDEPNKYPSRSEALFAVCCELVRAGLTNDQIYAVITDPDFGISSSVLEKGSKAEAYAKRQIERAQEEAIDPKLRKMNEKHAVIGDIGGKCVVISEVFDPSMNRTKISRQSFDHFRNRYLNTTVKIGTDAKGNDIYKKLGHWWLEHKNRRGYETLVFSPGRVVPESYNLWKGFACEALPGQCDLFLKHLKEIICSNNQEYYNYLLGWMAKAVQKPDSPGEVAIVLRGRMGTGKSFFAKAFGSLWGRHFLQVSDPKHLVGSFNSHLRDCVVLFGDEAFYAGDKKHESVLKTLITEEHITIEAKGVDAEAAPNYIHLILASNSKWVVPAGGDERRYFVLDVSDAHMQQFDYFSALHKEFNNGGREALLYFLMNYNLSEFDIRAVPKTEALKEQKLMSMGNEEEWWYNKLVEGRLADFHPSWNCEVLKKYLLDDYLNYMKDIGILRRANATALGRFLRQVCPEGWPRSIQKVMDASEIPSSEYNSRRGKQRPYFYVFPSLEECRARFDKMCGGPFTWPEVEIADPEDDRSPF